jgi:hypothetical protein
VPLVKPRKASNGFRRFRGVGFFLVAAGLAHHSGDVKSPLRKTPITPPKGRRHRPAVSTPPLQKGPSPVVVPPPTLSPSEREMGFFFWGGGWCCGMKADHDSPVGRAYDVHRANGAAGVRRKDMMTTIYHLDNSKARTKMSCNNLSVGKWRASAQGGRAGTANSEWRVGSRDKQDRNYELQITNDEKRAGPLRHGHPAHGFSRARRPCHVARFQSRILATGLYFAPVP